MSFEFRSPILEPFTDILGYGAEVEHPLREMACVMLGITFMIAVI